MDIESEKSKPSATAPSPKQPPNPDTDTIRASLEEEVAETKSRMAAL